MKTEVKLKYDMKYYTYLDTLRKSGETNMFGASPYLRKKWPILSRQEAIHILSDWMETFDSRHKK